MEKIQKTMKTKRFKHIVFCALVLLLIGWAVFRFAAVASENARYVFNAARVAADTGAPIEVIEMSRKSGVLYEPLSVQNNRAYVSGARAANLRAGQRVGNGKIVSVSSDLDLDTGMYVVRTSGVADGLQYAEYSANGYFVPLYAIADNSVLVVSDGVATPRAIKIARQDAENAYIASGLDDGDIVILSTVNAGDKVQIKQ
ncbi:MAG: hypothetical protein IJ273_01320 [Alphaproteobacteria bacterium]|nr:hypothetical protein [Alphaproteobacteria bacterium]MBQ8728806.1 hypothetical protein [Alphaproteobacteria bacterium]